MKKTYLQIDVKVFKEILKGKYCPEEENGTSKQILLETIQNITKTIIKIKGLRIDKLKALENINFNAFGFKEKSDAKITFTETIFEETEIILQAKNIYELEENIALPTPRNHKQKQYLVLMSDVFERLKIKCENVIDETEKQEHIEIYVNKNIQNITRTFYEAKTLLAKIQKHKANKDWFFVYVQIIFIINTILYLQNMFSAYYKEHKNSKKTLVYELWEAVGPNMFMEPRVEYGNTQNKPSEKVKLLGNSNVIITNYYDLMDLGVIENNPKLVEDHIYNNFLNKKGEAISRATINTCLKEYRTEKRVSGKKRVAIQTDLLR